MLRDDGMALFIEPLGHNPVINAYRRRTPEMRPPDEHPLRVDDLALAVRWFARSTSTTSTSSPSPPSAPSLELPASPPPAAHQLDQALFQRLPALRRHAWVAVLCLTRPRR